MKKYEYRCNRCLIIEEKWVLYSNNQPSLSVPCHKCGGLALRLPWSKSKEYVFEDFQKRQNNLD